MSYQQKYYQKYYKKNIQKYKKGGKYYKYKGKENHGGLIINYGKFIISFD
tara:strand:+ start:531 stop:680 length:150 start_codon:yes stop_codon:yes gene_type:complete